MSRSFLSTLVAHRGLRLLSPLAAVAMLATSVAVSACLFIREPAERHLIGARASYEEARQAQVRLQSAKKTLGALQKVWAVLPSQKDFASLAVAISELARGEQVIIPGMSYSLQKGEAGLPIKAALSFRAVGEYASIRRFIYRLETTGLYLIVESLDVSRSADSMGASRRAERRPTVVVFNIRVATFLKQDLSRAAGAT